MLTGFLNMCITHWAKDGTYTLNLSRRCVICTYFQHIPWQHKMCHLLLSTSKSCDIVMRLCHTICIWSNLKISVLQLGFTLKTMGWGLASVCYFTYFSRNVFGHWQCKNVAKWAEILKKNWCIYFIIFHSYTSKNWFMLLHYLSLLYR